MTQPMTAAATASTRATVARQAWPIILANAALPALGLVDTAVIGHYGTEVDLGALALGTLLFNFIYWTFIFLRMATTGFVAQAAGAGDEEEVRATLARSTLLGLAIGAAVILVQVPLGWLYFGLIDGSAAVREVAGQYYAARIWGAPAALALYAFSGALIALGKSRTLLFVHLFLNGLNAGLDVWLAGGLGMGARGIGLGTAIAEWATCLIAGALLLRLLRARHRDSQPFLPWRRIFDPALLRASFSANGNIMIRTLCLLAAFGFVTNQGARFGDVTLAANHVLLQFVSFSAFFLDGFAYVAEAQVGTAVGARDRERFRRVVRLTSELAIATAAALAGGIFLFGPKIIGVMTSLPNVSAAATSFLPWATLYVFFSVGAFQLDGVFIGATRTREMRNAGLVSVSIFIACAFPLVAHWGNHGLWAAFVIFVIARAGALVPYFRTLDAELGAAPPVGPEAAGRYLEPNDPREKERAPKRSALTRR